MKDINEIMRASVDDFDYIGERLRIIRDELIEKDTGNKRTSAFSRKTISERFDMARGLDSSPMSLKWRNQLCLADFFMAR